MAALRPLLALLLPWPTAAPVPCGPDLQVAVEVGGVESRIGLTQTIEHGTFEERVCEFVNGGYQGMIVLGCDEGELNATTEGCGPRVCLTYDALSVSMGEKTAGIMPLEPLPHGGQEERLCRIINPLYRGKMTIFCSYGSLSIDISGCGTQWDPLERPPWRPRSRHAAVGLSDGAILMAGGLGDEGPLQDLWQWTPVAGSLDGRWEQPWLRPVPPWTGRFGAAIVRQTTENGEQVTLLGGNDGRNRADVWRWLRAPSPVDVPLDASEATGTQPQDCTVDRGTLTCKAVVGISGRRWQIPYEQWPATDIFVDVAYSVNATDDGIAEPMVIIAIQLDTCRQVFQLRGGQWSTYGCTGTDPPWVESHRLVMLGNGGELQPGDRQIVHLAINRSAHEVVISVNGTVLLPRNAGFPRTPGIILDVCHTGAPSGISDTSACSAQPGARPELDLKVVEIAVWPGAQAEVRRVYLTAPAGSWQQLVDDAPWPSRSAHAVVALPDGDLLLMGGLGAEGLLSDVWRWSPRRCAPLPDLDPAEAARFALECSYACVPSAAYGQWQQLPNAPWAPRQEHATMWTAAGLLLLGGRTGMGFEDDVWRWTSLRGEFCSLAWQGRWELVTAAAGWPPRHGHGLVGFAPPGGTEVDTILLLAGFGGYPERTAVERTPPEAPVASLGDLWCANKALSNFTGWTELAPYGPFSARSQAAAVVAPTLGTYAMLLFGGYEDSARFASDVWRWTGENVTAECKVEDIGL